MDAISKIFPYDNPFFLPIWIVVAYLHVTLHELGHVVAALAGRMRIVTFSVWPIALQRRGDSWRWRRGGSLRVAGFVAVDPVTATDLRRRMILMVAGGPIATLLTFVVALLLVLLSSPQWPTWLVDGSKLLAFLGGLTFLLGLIPVSSKSAVSDAARIRMLSKATPQADRFCTLLVLLGASRAGMRPRDLNPELIATLPGPDDGSGDWIASSLTRYNFLVDTDRIEEARVALNSVLESKLPQPLRDMLALQAAWFEAKFRHDLSAARKWMPAKPANRKDAAYRNTLLRAQAAIAFLEGRLDDAERLAQESLEQGKRIDELGAATVIRERTEELLAEIRNARSLEARPSGGAYG